MRARPTRGKYARPSACQPEFVPARVCGQLRRRVAWRSRLLGCLLVVGLVLVFVGRLYCV